MAGNKSNYLAKKLLDHVLGGATGPGSAPYTAPSLTYLGLWTSTLDDSSTGDSAGEVSGGSYARTSQVDVGGKNNDPTLWPTATGAAVGTKSNGIPITFPTASASWGTITHFAICDALTSGNILYWGALTTSKVIDSGDTASFSAGALVVTED